MSTQSIHPGPAAGAIPALRTAHPVREPAEGGQRRESMQATQAVAAVVDATRTAATEQVDLAGKFWLDDAFWDIARNDSRGNFRARRRRAQHRFSFLGR